MLKTDEVTMSQPIDADIADWLVRVAPSGDATTVAEARLKSRTDSGLALQSMSAALVPASEVDAVIETGGTSLPIRVLRPASSGPHPTVVYFHGGGWVVGDLDTHLGHSRRICTQTDAVVVSVGCRHRLGGGQARRVRRQRHARCRR
jgi:acetyl esterase